MEPRETQGTRDAAMKHKRAASGERRARSINTCLLACWALLAPLSLWADAPLPASSFYNPAWASELSFTNNTLFASPTGSRAYLPDQYTPWWQMDVAHPVADYDSSKLPTGSVRLDGALKTEYTLHRLLPGWTATTSPTGIDNVYTFTPGSKSQQDQTARGGQSAFLDLGL